MFSRSTDWSAADAYHYYIIEFKHWQQHSAPLTDNEDLKWDTFLEVGYHFNDIQRLLLSIAAHS